MPAVSTFTDDALGDHDAVGLVEALHAGEVSVPEVVEAAIARVTAADAALGTIAYAAYDRARVEAPDPRGGFFAGVPTVVKDNVDVEGMPTMHGTDAWQGRPARRDGDFARMYLATGLIPLGKSRLSEYGFSPAAEHARLGPVRSPWSTDHVAGASSAGSAALVASGALPIAHANDGGGSIRIPAAVNGLVGLKPTRGRLAQDAIFRQMPVRIVSDGVVTRSVRDTAAFLREAEQVYRGLQLPPIGDITRPGRKRLRIALNTTGAGRGATAEIVELTLKTARPARGARPHRRGGRGGAGRRAVRRRLPPLLGLARAGDAPHRTPHPRQVVGRLPARQPHPRAGAAHAAQPPPDAGRGPPAAGHHQALGGFHERYDVILTPTLASETPRVGHLDPSQDYDVLMDRILDWVAFTPLQNATGDPAVSLPLATSSDGLPVGMMFGAAAGREASLLELAYELEEARPPGRITPS